MVSGWTGWQQWWGGDGEGEQRWEGEPDPGWPDRQRAQLQWEETEKEGLFIQLLIKYLYNVNL